MTSKPSLGIMAVSEKALALSFWQPVQWQAIVMIGRTLTFMRTCPHMQPPSMGRLTLTLQPPAR
jgi:hypothetical protein